MSKLKGAAGSREGDGFAITLAGQASKRGHGSCG